MNVLFILVCKKSTADDIVYKDQTLTESTINPGARWVILPLYKLGMQTF